MTHDDLHVFESLDEAVQAVAGSIADLSAKSNLERGRFTIALAGGSTPKPLYQLLATVPFASSIDWKLWHVFWGDERCVPPGHPDSNYRMAKEALLDHVPIPTTQVHRIHAEGDPEDAAASYERTIRDVFAPSEPHLDLVLLGMGDDGHTASLFAGTEAMEQQERLIVANWVPHLNAHRITTTFPFINAARNVVILATDAGKAPAVKRVFQPEADAEAPPIALVHPMGNDAQWYLTRSAVSLLTDAP